MLEQIKNSTFTITNVTRKNGKEAPPRLFDLTSLQVECNRKFAFSADETLKTIQSLPPSVMMSLFSYSPFMRSKRTPGA